MKFPVLGLVCAVAMATPALAVEWDAYVVRNIDGTIAPKVDPAFTLAEAGSGVGVSWSMTGSGKMAYGTNEYNNMAVGSIASFTWDVISGNAGYINFWVTDGKGNFAVIAPQISDGLGGWYAGPVADIQSASVKVYETPGAGGPAPWNTNTTGEGGVLNWMVDNATVARDGSGFLTINGSIATVSQLADLILAAPTDFHGAVGTGASRASYAVTVLANASDGSIDNVAVTLVPEASTLAVLGLGAAAALRRRR